MAWVDMRRQLVQMARRPRAVTEEEEVLLSPISPAVRALQATCSSHKARLVTMPGAPQHCKVVDASRKTRNVVARA